MNLIPTLACLVIFLMVLGPGCAREQNGQVDPRAFQILVIPW